jgi:hypothetical protein
MKGKWTLLGSILAVLLLALAAGLTWAQGPEPPGEGVQPEGDISIAATVSSKISYQGVLKENGQPVNAPRNMVFRFYTTSNCTGTPVQEVTKNNVPVSNGLFSVALEVSQNHFNGQGLWVAVDVGGTVVGCQEILPVPYALSLRPGARIQDGSASANLVTAELRGWPPILYPVGVKGEGTWGVYGYSANAIGVYGESASTSGTGVYGLAQATSGTTYGVYGKAQSPDGYGGYFENKATSGGVALYGKSDGATGVYGEGPIYGVYSLASALSGPNYGVYGGSRSSEGYGGYFVNLSTNGVALYANSSGSTRDKPTLRVINSESDRGMAAYLTNNSNYATAHFSNGGSGEVLYLQNGGTDAAGTGGGDFIKAVNKPEDDIQFRVTTSGDVYADGTFHTPAADFAELLPAVPGLEPGDVLVVGADGKLARSTQAYQPTVVGVYSTRPGFVGGQPVEGEREGHIPLAVVGVVPVKASAENGPIRPGDLLVASSIPGHAMKAGPNPPVGTVIGKALEGLDEGTGIIRMLVMLQ